MNAQNQLDARALDELRVAKRLLESPGLAVRIADALGRPIEKSIGMLPEKAHAAIQNAVRLALERAVDVALATMGNAARERSSDGLHHLAGVTSGALGGFFGLPGLAMELPVTTVVMLRSIGDIARSEGHDLGDPATRLACLEVFALGGPSSADDGTESGYFAVRAALTKLFSDAVQHVAQKGVGSRSSPVLVKFMERVATRFGIVVEEKVALEWLPVVGAVSGALVNSVFMGHFQNTARGHFVVRRLEAIHGADTVRRAYDSL
ncbi:MAG: EcsC family protein [bacterium]|nr:EcsC family protein [bacterium]